MEKGALGKRYFCEGTEKPSGFRVILPRTCENFALDRELTKIKIVLWIFENSRKYVSVGLVRTLYGGCMRFSVWYYYPLTHFYAFVRRMMRLRLHAKTDNAVCIVIFSKP